MVHQCDTLGDFKAQLAAAGDKLVVVDFYATWCGPCRMIAPKIEAFDKEMDDVVFLKVDVDKNSETAEEYEIEAMPTFIFFKSGKKLETMKGANEVKLRGLIEKYQ